MKRPDVGHAAAADLLRVACIGMIGWYHIWQQSWLMPVLNIAGHRLDLSSYVRTGYMFVDVMLVLSGFLTYLPWAAGKERPAREFYLRRALRILPSYWFALLVMLVLAVADPGFYAPGRLALDLLAHLGFVHNLWGFSYNASRLNVVLWTLAVEVQFYVLLPALAPVFKKHPLPAYLVMTAAGLSAMFLWTWQLPDTTLYVNRLPNMLVVYANGMLAAEGYARLCEVKKRRLWVALAGTLACAASVWGMLAILKAQSGINGYDLIRLGQLKWRWPLSACGALFLLGGSLSFRGVRAVLSNPPVRFLAGVSFNFYIWHQWIAVQLKNLRIPPYEAEINPNMAGEMPWQLHYTILCFIAALAAAVALTYLVEKPGAKLGRKLIERMSGGAEG